MKFSKHEINVVTEARATSPMMSQRGLAAKIYNTEQWQFNTHRTVASIYSVVRRTDRDAKAAAALASTPTTSRRRRTTSAV